MTKKNEKLNVFVPIDEGAEVKDYLENGNTIYCDLKSDEYWTKTSLILISNAKKLSITLDIKNRLETSIKKIKIMLIKTSINFWFDFCKNDELHYIFVEAKCKVLGSKQNLEFDIKDQIKTTPFDECKFLLIDH